MTDPLEALRSEAARVAPPDPALVRARARGIVRRRTVAMVSMAAVVVVAGGVGLVLRTPPPRRGVALVTATPPAAAERSRDSGLAISSEGRTPSSLSPAPSGALSALEGGAASSTVPGAAPMSPARPGPAPTLTLDVSTRPGAADFTLRACNDTSSSIEVDMTGQQYDFEVSRNGETVWHWSHGKVFPHTAARETWGPRTCRTYRASWTGSYDDGRPAAPGTYEVVGILASVPRYATAPESFCLNACG